MEWLWQSRSSRLSTQLSNLESKTFLWWKVGLRLTSEETLDFSCWSPAGVINAFVWLSSCLARLVLSSRSLLSSAANTHLKYFGFPKLFLRQWSKNPWSYFKDPTISGLLKQKQYSLTHPYFSVRRTSHQQRLRRLKWWRREGGAQTTQTWKCRYQLDLCECIPQTHSTMTYVAQSTQLISGTSPASIIFPEVAFSPFGTLRGCVSP